MPSAFYDFGRNMADVIQDLPGQGPTDPDAQATITDFIDYTEFFPSDLFRSLTLIGKLDTSYQEQASRVHRLTKTYGALPTIPSNERPSPQILRKDISFALDQARRYRQATFAEASRLCDTAETLYSRLVGIKRKLINLPKPPSCEPSPAAEPKAQLPERTRKPGLERTPRITLNVDTAHPTGGTGLRIANVPGEKKRRSRRIIVPGEVLPPLDPDSPGVSDTSETDSESPSSPVRLPTVSRPPPKLHRERTPKLPKPGVRIRPPGVMGTNVHSSVAGISVSNAMASLPAPPDNPKPGSTHAPWMELTEWELNGLRKRMKKNADWQPSATMVSRSLAERGRGAENMTKAKAHAEEAGDDFLDERPPEFVRPPVNAIEYKTEVASLESLENRGMKLNQAKKIKRDMMREQAAREHSEHDEFSQRITNIGMAVKKIFETPSYSSLASPTDKKESKTPNRKRKREKSVSAAADQDAETPSEAQSNEPIKPKKLKLTSPAATAHGTTTTTHIPLAQAGPAAPSEASATSPPEVKRSQARSLRTSGASTKATTPAEDLPRQYDSARPGTSGSAVIRPRSSRGTPTISLTFKNGLKAASAEPPSRRISLRRNSDTGASPGVTNRRLAPAVSGVNGRVRGRRPAPGLQINYGDEGGAKVSVGKRKSAPSKRKPANQSTTGKRPSSTAKMELQTNTEDDGDVDPDEPRYCICGDVSFGTMIACENEDCEKEWFHLGCVGLQEIPGRRTKWYCPDCRVKFGAGSDGCVDAGTRRR